MLFSTRINNEVWRSAKKDPVNVTRLLKIMSPLRLVDWCARCYVDHESV